MVSFSALLRLYSTEQSSAPNVRPLQSLQAPGVPRASTPRSPPSLKLGVRQPEHGDAAPRQLHQGDGAHGARLSQ